MRTSVKQDEPSRMKNGLEWEEAGETVAQGLEHNKNLLDTYSIDAKSHVDAFWAMLISQTH